MEATGEGRALREQPTHLTGRTVLALADFFMSVIFPWSTLTHSGCHAAERAFLHLAGQQRTRDGEYCGGERRKFYDGGSGNGCGRRERWTSRRTAASVGEEAAVGGGPEAGRDEVWT